ncbi:Calcium-binding protein CML24 [Corchorus olitorius]|uniref:Calcium-binding protein CML24 n=1 Tax=Corchorus olitorius TaxID=93759 RepID=A0A1R3IY05_9ROSI|nr:Calcium-binding protein CML24 [Corchorus olitorius]
MRKPNRSKETSSRSESTAIAKAFAFQRISTQPRGNIAQEESFPTSTTAIDSKPRDEGQIWRTRNYRVSPDLDSLKQERWLALYDGIV